MNCYYIEFDEPIESDLQSVSEIGVIAINSVDNGFEMSFTPSIVGTVLSVDSVGRDFRFAIISNTMTIFGSDISEIGSVLPSSLAYEFHRAVAQLKSAPLFYSREKTPDPWVRGMKAGT
jgi:hypothetical protein